MCEGPCPFARAVGGCAGAVRWERLPRVLEAIRRAGAVGWRCGGRSGNYPPRAPRGPARRILRKVIREYPFIKCGRQAFFAWMAAAPQALPKAPDRKRPVFLAGPPLFRGTCQVFPGNPGRKTKFARQSRRISYGNTFRAKRSRHQPTGRPRVFGQFGQIRKGVYGRKGLQGAEPPSWIGPGG